MAEGSGVFVLLCTLTFVRCFCALLMFIEVDEFKAYCHSNEHPHVSFTQDICGQVLLFICLLIVVVKLQHGCNHSYQ